MPRKVKRSKGIAAHSPDRKAKAVTGDDEQGYGNAAQSLAEDLLGEERLRSCPATHGRGRATARICLAKATQGNDSISKGMVSIRGARIGKEAIRTAKATISTEGQCHGIAQYGFA